MAPNRKEVASILRTLSQEELAGFVRQAKYAPLTSGAAVAPAPEPSKPTEQQQQTTTEAEQAQQQEQQRYEEIEDTKPRAAEIVEDRKPPAAETSNNCWDEATQQGEEEKEEQQQPKGDSYWGWPPLSPQLDAEVEALEAEDEAKEEEAAWAEEVARRQAVIAQIMAEEQARSVVSLGNIEAHLKQDAQRRSKEAIVSEIVAEEEARAVVSLSNIEAHLKRDAKRRSETAEVIRSEEKVEEDGYWDWDDENDVPPNEETFSAAHVEELLKKEVARIKVHSRVGLQETSREQPPPKDFWEWPTLTKDEAKQKLIESILEEERIRQMLTSDHIVSQLESDAVESSTEACRSEEKSPEDYWSWTGEGASSNVVKSPCAQDSSHPPNDYWDWTPAPSEGIARQSIIDRILRDEAARQAFAASHMEENLRADTWRRAKAEVDDWYFRREESEVRRLMEDTEELAAEEESYWDM